MQKGVWLNQVHGCHVLRTGDTYNTTAYMVGPIDIQLLQGVEKDVSHLTSSPAG
jgi:hypothetical protein